MIEVTGLSVGDRVAAETLELHVRGLWRKRVAAYWNGLPWVI